LAKEHAFQRASVLLLPSYSEGLPYSVLEAMSYGVPTICTDVGALPDVVQHGVEGFLVEPKNVEKLSEAMEKLLSNPLLVKNMGEKSRDKMQASYSLDALNKKFKKAWFDASV
jgi:glycosyltransferase involved in cell wall biosynthesis